MEQSHIVPTSRVQVTLSTTTKTPARCFCYWSGCDCTDLYEERGGRGTAGGGPQGQGRGGGARRHSPVVVREVRLHSNLEHHTMT